jgi:tripartite-type tricarboxylate transporter receptor subunit TctC
MNQCRWLLLMVAVTLSACSKQESSGHYYEGKRIEIVIPTSVGGGTDRFARLMGDGLNKHVPGNPVIVPRQMTSGGGILAGNWAVEQAPKDGTVLLAGTGQGALRQLLGQKAVRSKPEHFDALIAVPVARTVTIAPNKGVTKIEDVRNLRKGKPLHTALVDPISGITFVLQAAMLEMPLKIIPGYHGGKDRDLAMFRGEIDIIQQATTTFAASTQPLIDRGAVLLWNDGFAAVDGSIERDPGMPDTPTFGEVYAAAYGEPPSGEMWELYRAIVPMVSNAAKVLLLPVGAPAEAKEALKTGIKAMVADPEFIERVRRESEGHGPIHGEELDRLLSGSRSLKPDQIAFLRKYIGERFEIEFE